MLALVHDHYENSTRLDPWDVFIEETPSALLMWGRGLRKVRLLPSGLAGYPVSAPMWTVFRAHPDWQCNPRVIRLARFVVLPVQQRKWTCLCEAELGYHLGRSTLSSSSSKARFTVQDTI